MAYLPLIDKQLRVAFNQVKDIAVIGYFRKRTNASFDFNTVTASETVSTAIPAKVIIIDGVKQDKGASRIKKQLMVKSKEIGELSQYDTVEINGKVWTISGQIKNSGFIYVLEIMGEP